MQKYTEVAKVWYGKQKFTTKLGETFNEIHSRIYLQFFKQLLPKVLSVFLVQFKYHYSWGEGTEQERHRSRQSRSTKVQTFGLGLDYIFQEYIKNITGNCYRNRTEKIFTYSLFVLLLLETSPEFFQCLILDVKIYFQINGERPGCSLNGVETVD